LKKLLKQHIELSTPPPMSNPSIKLS